MVTEADLLDSGDLLELVAAERQPIRPGADGPRLVLLTSSPEQLGTAVLEDANLVCVEPALVRTWLSALLLRVTCIKQT